MRYLNRSLYYCGGAAGTRTPRSEYVLLTYNSGGVTNWDSDHFGLSLRWAEPDLNVRNP